MSLDPVAIARELVRIPSPTGHEGPVVDYLAGFLETLGYRIQRHPITPGRDNIYAFDHDPAVVFSTHLDVVPPHLDLHEDDEWLYGRGSCDAKGIAAAMIVAAERLRSAGQRAVGLLFVVGEETVSDGARAAIHYQPRGRFLINGEPTNNALSIAQKGALTLSLIASGKAAHSAYPEEGESAIEALLDALERIKALPMPTDPTLGTTTLNIGTLQGGVAANVIAPHAEALLMYRTVSDHDAIESQVRAAAGTRVSVERRSEFPSVIAPRLDGWDAITVKYASDLAHLRSWGIGYQLGPGDIRVAHTANERVRKADLRLAVDKYCQLATQLIGAPIE